MIIDAKSAAVDNDFVDHIVESRIDDAQLVAILNKAFSELGLTAIMHPLVYEKELMKDRKRVKSLFSGAVIYKVEFADIFQGDSGKKQYYTYLVSQLYRGLTGKTLQVSSDNILTYWVRRNSLGEVHSVAMCLVCGCGIFLSDDGDSKALGEYIKRMSLGEILVYNRREFFEKHAQEGTTAIPRHERKSLTHIKT